MSRYKVHGEWFHDAKTGFGGMIMVADAIDTKNGDIFREGAWHVTTAKPGTKGSKGRPFYGETAWMDAERLASDLALAKMYG